MAASVENRSESTPNLLGRLGSNSTHFSEPALISSRPSHLNAAPSNELCAVSALRPRSNSSQTIQAFGCVPLTNRKSFCRTFAATTGKKGIIRDEQGNRLGERAPIPRDSFVVPSNRGLPSPSKMVSPGAGRGVGTSRSGGARSLLRGLRPLVPPPTTGNIGKNCGAGRACLRLVGRGSLTGAPGRTSTIFILNLRPTY